MLNMEDLYKIGKEGFYTFANKVYSDCTLGLNNDGQMIYSYKKMIINLLKCGYTIEESMNILYKDMDYCFSKYGKDSPIILNDL